MTRLILFLSEIWLAALVVAVMCACAPAHAQSAMPASAIFVLPALIAWDAIPHWVLAVGALLVALVVANRYSKRKK